MDFSSVQTIIVFFFGTILIITLLVLAVIFPKPTQFQYNIFRITFSLAAAGVAAMIPGFINLQISPTVNVFIRAGGAMAIFIVVFFFNPAKYKTDTKESQRKCIQVAAICYRYVNNSIEFLLVNTTGGRWTFPKGNIDSNEDNWFAAQREAFEEAGVTGSIEHNHLTTYLHEKREWKIKGIEIEIYAFLLRVKDMKPPEEVQRNPTWFSFELAEKALVKGRRFKYAQEFRRVLGKAARQIIKRDS